MLNKEHQLKLMKDFSTAKSERLYNFLKYPENAIVFILLIPPHKGLAHFKIKKRYLRERKNDHRHNLLREGFAVRI